MEYNEEVRIGASNGPGLREDLMAKTNGKKAAGVALLGFFALFAAVAAIYLNLHGCSGGACPTVSKASAASAAGKSASRTAVSASVSSVPAAAPAAGKVAYLTFDDGPSRNTVTNLATLKKYGVHATFFVVGHTDAFSLSMYKQIVADGNAVGIHSYTHEYPYIYKSAANFFSDFYKLDALIYQNTGVHPKIMRFPGGSGNTVSNDYCRGVMTPIIAELRQKGYVYFDWNVSACDSETKPPAAALIAYDVIHGAQGKKEAVILMHDSAPKKTTAEALPAVIEGLRKEGFSFGVLSPSVKPVQQKKEF